MLPSLLASPKRCIKQEPRRSARGDLAGDYRPQHMGCSYLRNKARDEPSWADAYKPTHEVILLRALVDYFSQLVDDTTYRNCAVKGVHF